MKEDYQETGYLLRRSFFQEQELRAIEPILRAFHDSWMADNRPHYENGAINSAYITHKDRLDAKARQTLFTFIAQDGLTDIANNLIPCPAFMNTQLFFDPFDADQKNYWHRDIQYTPHSLDEQAKMLTAANVLHLRVPLVDEPGIELVPGTHHRWDTPQELETRMTEKGRAPHHDLPGSKSIPLKRGDLLVFSANMIHRGLYGGNRFAFDIIYCDADPELLRYVEPDCLPDDTEIKRLSNASLYQATRSAPPTFSQ